MAILYLESSILEWLAFIHHVQYFRTCLTTLWKCMLLLYKEFKLIWVRCFSTCFNHKMISKLFSWSCVYGCFTNVHLCPGFNTLTSNIKFYYSLKMDKCCYSLIIVSFFSIWSEILNKVSVVVYKRLNKCEKLRKYCFNKIDNIENTTFNSVFLAVSLYFYFFVKFTSNFWVKIVLKAK